MTLNSLQSLEDPLDTDQCFILNYTGQSMGDTYFPDIHQRECYANKHYF